MHRTRHRSRPCRTLLECGALRQTESSARACCHGGAVHCRRRDCRVAARRASASAAASVRLHGGAASRSRDRWRRLLALIVVAWIGLWRQISWAPAVYAVTWVVCVIVVPFGGPYVGSGAEELFDFVSTSAGGAILAVLFVPTPGPPSTRPVVQLCTAAEADPRHVSPKRGRLRVRVGAAEC